MAVTLDGKLVVAISSRALFDFEEENRLFETGDDRAYMKLQLERLDTPAQPGVAFSLVHKLLAFNDADAQRVEVVILSRNDPVSGMRVFRSAQHYGLPIQRGSFTRGQPPWRYLRPLRANLFLSTHLADVRAALDAGVPAAQVYPHSVHASDAHPHEVRIAFDGDAVLFSDEAERVYQSEGLSAFQEHEASKASLPLAGGPFKPLLEALHRLQSEGTPLMRVRTALVTARSAPAHERAIRTLMNWNIEVDEAMFLGGLPKGEFLREFEPDFFFDDQTGHIESASMHVPAGHVASGISESLIPNLEVTMTLSEKFQSFCVFARKVGRLTVPYFQSEEKWKARLLLAAIVALNLASVYMLVLLNEWNRVFYDALQNKDAAVFWRELGRFTYLAFGFIIIAVYRFYLTQLLEMRWRAWMTGHYLDRWLSNKAFYHLELARFARGEDAPPDNPDQRIAEDMNLFTSYTVSLTMGLLNAVVTLVSFVGILWALSGSFAFSFNGSEYTIPGFMVWMAVLYCALGSVITHYLGRSQIALNFKQQRYEADFRHHLVRVREYSESIALDRGEPVERQQLGGRFGEVIGNYLKLINAQKRLTWFTVGFGQAAVVFPFIVAAPRFFSGAIQLGELIQISSAFGRVQDSLSWFVDNYSSLAAWRATTDRITSFEESFQALEAAEHIAAPLPNADDAIAIDNLQLALPGGVALLAVHGLQVSPGDTVLVKGPSGSGKSTLFRGLAGIWPWAQRILRTPESFANQVMFLPQRPYFPLGSLRDALAYPEPANRYSDTQLQQALTDALLPDLGKRLDEHDAWGQKLSGGEQQRLAIARAMLKKPRWLFVDEATSALDEAAEATVYGRMQALVKASNGALVSIAHRPGVAEFHRTQWTSAPDAAGEARYRLVTSTT